MPHTDVVEEMREERKKQKQSALNKLEEFTNDKITLKRPVFFVPGWTDEACACWEKSDNNNTCIKDWLAKICSNPEEARYINFEKETSQCKSFLDFGEVLKNKVWSYIDKNKEFDIVGHSMGGLDIRAAIAQNGLLNTKNCLTVATPHQGDNLGGMDAWLRKIPWIESLWGKIRKETSYQVEQSKSLDPDYEPIKIINKVANITVFLEKIEQLYEFKGTMDFTVKGSAYINTELYKNKIRKVTIDGADHTGKTGITQDPRTVLAIIKILLGIKLEALEDLKNNHGIFIGGVQTSNC